MLSLDKIYHAAFILKSVARKTDLIAAPHLSEGNNLYPNNAKILFNTIN